MQHSRTEQREITANTGKLSASSVTQFFKQGFQARFLSKQTFYGTITPHFNLKEPKSNKPTTVYFVVWIDKKQHRINTGCKVYPKYWAVGRAMESRNIPMIENRNNCILNDKIEEMCMRFDEYKYYLCSGEINHSFNTLKHYMKTREIKEEKVDIIARMRDAVLHDSIKEGTQDNYFRVIETFERFYKTKGEPELTLQLFNEYQKWCIDNLTGRNGNGKASTGTVNDRVKNTLVVIKKYLVTTGIIEKSVYDEISVVKPLQKKNIDDEIALMDDEVLRIYNHKCENERDETIKDLLVLECLTGQRFSDVDKVTKNIETKDGRTYINIVQDKTSGKIQVDIKFQIALDIIKKYDYKLPTVSRSSFNKRIKQIAKDAGITGEEEIRKQIAGEAGVDITHKQRYDCISSHTGRRTFTTLLSLRGYNYNEISRYTGHDTLEMVQRYDKSKKGTKIKTQFEDLKKNHPELVLKMTEKNTSEKEGTTHKKVSVLNGLFAYDDIKELMDMKESGVNIYKAPKMGNVIRTIKNTTNKWDKIKQLMTEHNTPIFKSKVYEIQPFIWNIGKFFADPNIYLTYQYKLETLGIIEGNRFTENELDDIWNMEVLEEEQKEIDRE